MLIGSLGKGDKRKKLVLIQSNGFNCYISMKEPEPVYLCPIHRIDLIEIKGRKNKKLICPECGQEFNKNKLKGEVLI